MTEPRPDSQVATLPAGRYRTATLLLFGLVAAIAFVATALVFAVASGTRDAADDGQTAVLTEAALGAASAARNAAVQAHLLGEANALGLATESELEIALQQAEYTMGELGDRVERLLASQDEDSADTIVAGASIELNNGMAALIESIRAKDIERSSRELEEDIAGSYQVLATRLAADRDRAMERLAIAGEDAGRIADAARFLVVVIVPVAVLIAYRRRTQRDQTNRDLEHLLEKHRAVSEAREEFIQNLSHELRTPLTAIYGFSLELFDEDRESTPGIDRELLSFIVSESAELSRMIEDILVAGSVDQDGLSINMREVDPVSEIESVVQPMRVIGARVETILEAATICADPLRFAQVMRNLISNALRHGGPDNLVFGRVEGERYVVQVRDNGEGLPKHIEERLFAPFIHRGDEPLLTGSVGLGLAVAHLVTTRSGGTISYWRDRDETVFSVTFPLTAAAVVEPEPRLNAILR